MNTVFPAKVSWWLFGPILCLLLGSFAVSLIQGALLAALILLGIAAFVAYVVLGTRYTLTSTDLLISCGPFASQVPVQQITRVLPSNNPISSPAPSLDRLEISYNKFDSVLISPRDKAAFVNALTQLNTHIQLA